VDDDELGKDEFPNIGALDESHPRETVIHDFEQAFLLTVPSAAQHQSPTMNTPTPIPTESSSPLSAAR